MDMGFTIGFWVIWTFIAFWIGFLAHWWSARKHRRLLKLYRQQAQALRKWNSPIE